MHTQETRIYFALLAGVIVLLALMAFFIVSIIRYQRKRAAYDRGNIKQQFKYLESERERIASDLHDDVGASLSAIKLHLQVVQPENEAMKNHIEFAEAQIDVIMETIRSISQNMMPAILKRKGLKDALLELTSYLIQPAGINVQITASEIDSDPETAIQLYRIAQEILNNIIKHSDASSMIIELEQQGGGITLHIADDGKGFKKNLVIQQNKGNGLRNIMARIAFLHAKIYLTTAPGKGVDYLIKINYL